MENTEQALAVLGEKAQSGAYLLRMWMREPLALAFGRFRGGDRLHLPAGAYVYVGSAMGQKGPSSLARRLIRHATRSGNRPPHAIRSLLLQEFAHYGLGSGDLRLRGEKSLHWHVDYLLDSPGVTLTHVLAVRSSIRLEEALAELVATRSYSALPARGLGASDTRGGTHLFAVHPAAGWWEELLRLAQNALIETT